jgi:hypothetical protein
MSDEKDYREEIEIKGSELVDRVKQLIEEGNVRRLIIRKQDGEILMEVPLTASVLAGGALLVFTPVLAALGAAAAFLAQAKIEIVRVGDKNKIDESNEKTKVDIE